LARTYYYSAPLRFVWNFVLPALTLFQKNVNRPATSGRRLAALASGKMGDLTGKYTSMGKVFPSSPLSQDRAKARELWDASASATDNGIPLTRRLFYVLLALDVAAAFMSAFQASAFQSGGFKWSVTTAFQSNAFQNECVPGYEAPGGRRIHLRPYFSSGLFSSIHRIVRHRRRFIRQEDLYLICSATRTATWRHASGDK